MVAFRCCLGSIDHSGEFGTSSVSTSFFLSRCSQPPQLAMTVRASQFLPLSLLMQDYGREHLLSFYHRSYDERASNCSVLEDLLWTSGQSSIRPHQRHLPHRQNLWFDSCNSNIRSVWQADCLAHCVCCVCYRCRHSSWLSQHRYACVLKVVFRYVNIHNNSPMLFCSRSFKLIAKKELEQHSWPSQAQSLLQNWRIPLIAGK